ncbi:MAG: PKD domain-containing protein, partial [Planctomycetales bacterium]|nr:PKD domain-containing protein [Planctomycetales bacterium]
MLAPVDVSESIDGNFAFITGRDADSVVVVSLDGRGAMAQRLSNNSAGLTGLESPLSMTGGTSSGSTVVATLGDSNTLGGIVSFRGVSEVGNAPIQRSGQLQLGDNLFVLPDSFGESESVIAQWRFQPQEESYLDAFRTEITPLILRFDESSDTWTITGIGKMRLIDAGFGDIQEFAFDLQAGSDETTGKYFGWYVRGDVPAGVTRGTVDFDEETGETIVLDLTTGDSISACNSDLAGCDSTFTNSTTIRRAYSMQVSFTVTEAADAVRAQFIDIESLIVGTAGGADRINIAATPGPDVTSLDVSTGDTIDRVLLSDLSETTQINLGTGDDEVTIATSTDASRSLTVHGDSGKDTFNLVTVGAATSTMLNGGVDEDLFLIAGNQLGSGTTTTIDGGAPTLGAIGDTLVFNPGDPSVTVNPSDPAPSGQVGIDDVAFGVVDFSDIEALVIESGPRIDIANRVPLINEGQSLSLSVSIANIPQNTGVTGVTWSVAGVEIDNGNSTTLDLSWAQLLGLGINDGDDIYPILVSATNDGDITTTETILLEVLDVAPIINLTADATVRVGDTHEVEFSAADPGDDAIIKWLVDWGDGTLQEYGSGVASAQHIYETPETYDVVVSVVDDESTPDVAATTTKQVAAFVNVSNVNAGMYSIKEGESLHLAGSVVGQPISVSWDLNGDGTFGDATQLNAVLDWATDLAALGIDGRSHAEISIALQATYANGDSATRSGSLIIENVAPVAVLSTDVPTVGIDEGIAAGDIYQVMFSSIVEPASGDTLTYSFDFGDDGTIDAVVTDPQNPSALIPATWTGGGLQDDGFVTIRGIVEDQDGGRSEYTTTFRVNDVAPTVLLGGAAIATEGSSYQLTINFSDPGTNDGDINFVVDWGDGSAAEMFTPASQVSPVTISHVFVDNDPLATTTISVRASDEKGTYQAVTKNINVANVAPTISSLTAENASGGVVIVEGDIVSLAGFIIDPGVLDSFTLDVDWGDGSVDNDLFLTARSTNFDVVHRYVDDGTYTISATLTDDDLDSNTQVATVVVTNDAPMLTYTVSPLAVDEGDSVTVAGTIADAGEN